MSLTKLMCQYLGDLPFSSCPAWYEVYASRETIIAAVSAAVGAIAGGFATVAAETMVARRENRTEHQSKIIMIVAKTTVVRADLEALHGIFTAAKADAEEHPAPELWQFIYRIAFSGEPAGYNADDTYALFLLRDRILLEKAGGLFKNHADLLEHVKRYNDTKAQWDEHVKDRLYYRGEKMFIRSVEGDLAGVTMKRNLDHLLQHMDGEVSRLLEQVVFVQKQIGIAAKRHFWSKKFLKLRDTKPLTDDPLRRS